MPRDQIVAAVSEVLFKAAFCCRLNFAPRNGMMVKSMVSGEDFPHPMMAGSGQSRCWDGATGPTAGGSLGTRSRPGPRSAARLRLRFV
jgi:hypothetical protein